MAEIYTLQEETGAPLNRDGHYFWDIDEVRGAVVADASNFLDDGVNRSERALAHDIARSAFDTANAILGAAAVSEVRLVPGMLPVRAELVVGSGDPADS